VSRAAASASSSLERPAGRTAAGARRRRSRRTRPQAPTAHQAPSRGVVPSSARGRAATRASCDRSPTPACPMWSSGSGVRSRSVSVGRCTSSPSGGGTVVRARLSLDADQRPETGARIGVSRGRRVGTLD
jgi:hypothetical protein